MEIEFGRRVEEVKQELAQELPAEVAPEPSNNALLHLAEASPRAAVLEAWREVELAALEAARKIGGQTFQNRTLTFQAIRVLEQSESLDRIGISLGSFEICADCATKLPTPLILL